MDLRKKIILFVFIIMCLTFLATLITSNLVVLNGFENLEKQEVQTQLSRATNALNSKITDLNTFVSDWSIWDDSYQFVQDNNTKYVQSNLGDQAMTAANLNVIFYINSAGQIMYSEANAPSNQESLNELSNIILNSSQTWQFNSTDSWMDGILPTSQGTFIISLRPIVTSQNQGPIMGTLIMGRELTPYQVSLLQNETNLQMSIVNYADNNLSIEIQGAKANLIQSGLESSYIKPVNSSVINGYTTMPDLLGNPCIILGVSIQRTIYLQGINTVNTYLLQIALWFSVFGIAMVVILEKAFLSRVAKINKSVSNITNASDVSQRGILKDSKFSKSNDELSTLTKSINHMLDRIQEMTEKLNRTQRFAAIGELSVMVAHDVRNPLQGIKIAADCLKKDNLNAPEKRAEILNLIQSDVSYSEKIVDDLLGYSREIRLELSETDPKTLLSKSLRRLNLPENIYFNDLTQNEPKIQLDVDKISRVYDNLLKNAIDAMTEGGKLTVKSYLDDGALHISFTDTGKGIAPEHLPKLFTPLFTTKAKGMGFGLAICHRIVEAHKGKISVESTLNSGTTFNILLPTDLH
jgi:signal transduction histidine kinase